MTASKTLLAIFEWGGYPDFTPLYRQLGFEVETVRSGRKAIQWLKTHVPDVIVAEFNHQPDFRERTSNLESILAVVQRHPSIRVIVFYEAENAHLLEKLRGRFPLFEAMTFPIEPKELEQRLRE
jgi:DNA-binding NtrC family response regulator